MTRTLDTAPRTEREVFFALAVTAETLGHLLIAGDAVGEKAGELLLEHARLAKITLGLTERAKAAPDRDGLEHAVVQELDDAGAAGLAIKDAVDRLWADFADHYAHRASLRKAIYDVLTTLVKAGTVRSSGAKRGAGARYYDATAAAPEEGARLAASQ